MKNRQFRDVLDKCLTLLTEEGVSVEACVARYPEHAAELRPLLEVVVEMRRVPQPALSQAAFDAGKRRMLEAVRERRAQQDERSARSLLGRGEAWIARLLAGLRQATSSRGFGWQAALATAAVLLIVAIGGGLLLPTWLGETVARTARLDVVAGEVEVQAAESGAWVPASSRRRLEAGDRIRTAGQGVARLTFFDGSTTALDEGTELALVELTSRRDGTSRSIVLHQQRGQTRHDVRPLRSATARFHVQTPTALTAVRGTTFAVVVEADGATQVAVWKGLVEVESLTDGASDGKVELQPGWFTSVEPNRPPSEPIVVPTPRREELFPELATPRPTETATPSLTPMPTWTPSGTPSATPPATSTPLPTPESVEPGATKERPTAQPTDEDRGTPTPPATATPTPTATGPSPPEPSPTSTPTPTVTPPPTSMPPSPPGPSPIPTRTATPTLPPTSTPPSPPGP